MGRNAKEARNAEIGHRYCTGETMEEIGSSHGITRERVRQILERQRVLTGQRQARGNAHRVQAMRARRDRKIAAHRQAIIELAHQGLTIKEIAQRVRFSRYLVERVLHETFSEEERRVLLNSKSGLERIPKAQLLEQVREAYRALGPTMRVQDYGAYAKAHGWTGSIPTIYDRFGKWSRACELAGVSLQVKRRPRRREKNFIDRATCLAAVREVRDQLGFIPSYRQYERYARSTRGLPCASTVKKRCGGWRNVIRLLLMDSPGPHESSRK